jgi:hypothetical protein
MDNIQGVSAERNNESGTHEESIAKILVSHMCRPGSGTYIHISSTPKDESAG